MAFDPFSMIGNMFGFGVGAISQQRTNEANIKAMKEINQKNIDFQRETNLQQEGFMRESWARDDSAVQRRRADLIAAGMSPLMAAGDAAGNSGPVNVSSPVAHHSAQRENIVDPTFLMSAINSAAQIKNMAETRRIADDKVEQADRHHLTDASLKVDAMHLDRYKHTLDYLLREKSETAKIALMKAQAGSLGVLDDLRRSDKMLTEERKKLIEKEVEALIHDLGLAKEGDPTGMKTKTRQGMTKGIEGVLEGIFGGLLGGLKDSSFGYFPDYKNK